MKSNPMLLFPTTPVFPARSGSWRCWQCQWRQRLGSGLAIAAIAGLTAAPSHAVPDVSAPAIAQALPTPLPPLPTNSGVSTTSGEQYLVLVDGDSESLLQQVRQVEPGAFVNYVDGRSVIQAGRFTSFQNAQIRADELATFGIGAAVQPTNFSGVGVAIAPPPDYTLAYPTPGEVYGAVPTTAIAATPSTIEFGQAAPFPTAPNGFPGAAPYPGGGVPAPLGAPLYSEDLPSGYYVVIPWGAAELPSLASQVVALGAPSSLVHTRTAPRGPHVAIGPYDDHGIAQEWSNYLKGSGVPSARVHFE